MKNRLLLLIYLIIQFSCSSKVQSPSSLLNENSINLSIDSTSRIHKITEVEFRIPKDKTTSSKLIIKPEETAYLSPSKTKVAIVSPTKINDSLCEVKIYDLNGKLSKILRVEPLSNLAVSDKGSLVMFGYPSYIEQIIFQTYIYFYNDEGIELNHDTVPYLGECIGQFSKNGEFILISERGRTFSYQKPVEFFIFNRERRIISQKTIDDWSIYFEVYYSRIIIDEQTNKVKILYKKGNTNELIKCSKSFDKSGNLLETREGWEE